MLSNAKHLGIAAARHGFILAHYPLPTTHGHCHAATLASRVTDTHIAHLSTSSRPA